MIAFGTSTVRDYLMHFIGIPRVFRSGLAIATVSLFLTIALEARAIAGELLGLYVGGAVGAGRIETNSGGVVPSATDHFDENHVAFKAMVGVRPLSWIGGEISYVDFGRPNGTLGGAPANVSLRGVSAFGVVYLPVPVIDIFLKAGAAHLESTVNGEAYQACPALVGIACAPTVPFRVEHTDTHFSAGAGVQYKIGSFALRGEYERFSTASDHPELLSIGLTWTFL
jgi:hypothetical protein